MKLLEHFLPKTENQSEKLSDKEVFAAAVSHLPIDCDTTEAKEILSGALAKIIPCVCGVWDFSLPEKRLMKNIRRADTDTLMIAFKGLLLTVDGEFYDRAIIVQKRILEELKKRLS